MEGEGLRLSPVFRFDFSSPLHLSLLVDIFFLPAPTNLCFPPPPSRSPSLPLSLPLPQMVNLYGLLVKSTSPDGIHLETGLHTPRPPLYLLILLSWFITIIIMKQNHELPPGLSQTSSTQTFVFMCG